MSNHAHPYTTRPGIHGNTSYRGVLVFVVATLGVAVIADAIAP